MVLQIQFASTPVMLQIQFTTPFFPLYSSAIDNFFNWSCKNHLQAHHSFCKSNLQRHFFHYTLLPLITFFNWSCKFNLQAHHSCCKSNLQRHFFHYAIPSLTFFFKLVLQIQFASTTFMLQIQFATPCFPLFSSVIDNFF